MLWCKFTSSNKEKLKLEIMKTCKAIKLYNEAEKHVKLINDKKCFIDRAIDIEEYLTKMYGDEMADEILESVF